MNLEVLTGEVDDRWKLVEEIASNYRSLHKKYEREFNNNLSSDYDTIDSLERSLGEMLNQLEAAYLHWLRAKLGYQAEQVIRLLAGPEDWLDGLVREVVRKEVPK